jgi:hypothetical protein
MQRQLVVNHPGNDKAGPRRAALFDIKRHNRAADPGPGLDLALSTAEHCLEIDLGLCPT